MDVKKKRGRWRRVDLAHFSGLPPLLFRMILMMVFLQSGWYKIDNFAAVSDWFESSQYGLGMLGGSYLVGLLAGLELLAGACLLAGVATRVAVLPMLLILLVSMFAFQWGNGWQWIAEPEAWLASERVNESAERMAVAQAILQTYGDYDWLVEKGHLVILNNGIEQSVIYISMLLSLAFTGGGRYVSFDYWFKRYWEDR